MYLHKSDLVKQTAKVNNNRKVALILKNLQEVECTAHIYVCVQYTSVQPRVQHDLNVTSFPRGSQSESFGWNLEVLFIIIEQTSNFAG